MVYEPGHDTPIGISRRPIPFVGLELMGPNCATCHNAAVRETAVSEPVVYLGAPGAQFDVESFNLFLLDCVLSDAFTSGNLGDGLREAGEPSWLLRYVAPFLGFFVDDARELAGAIVTDGPWGPGRDDAIGLSAAFILGEEFIPAIPAPVDYPSSWNQDVRRGGRLHWDGAAATADERNVLVSIGSGTPHGKVPFSSIHAIQRFIEDDLDAPPYPFDNGDDGAIARGETLFASACAECHSPFGARFGDVMPVAEIGTDPNRVLVITDASTQALNAMRGPGWQFGGFENTQGYLNGLLDGVWLRAPYLHNGSVPTMRALLSPPDERPTTFYRGYTVYDQADMGYVSTVPPRENDPTYGLLDTTLSGNTNGGHVYGTDLSEADKDDLIAYLRTL
jgi:mono/diheme cytochrome c family protein